jgi:hypothetical protein
MQVTALQKAFYFGQPAQQRGQGFVLVAALLSKPGNLVAEPADFGRQRRGPAVGHATLPARANPRTSMRETRS